VAASGTLGNVKISISIVLFFLLSAFFLSVLLGALEHSRRLLGVAAACLVAVVCVIVFLTPVQLPSLDAVFGVFDGDPSPTATTEVPGVQ
jgi:predicted branched-subunit amino acid permease